MLARHLFGNKPHRTNRKFDLMTALEKRVRGSKFYMNIYQMSQHFIQQLLRYFSENKTCGMSIGWMPILLEKLRYYTGLSENFDLLVALDDSGITKVGKVIQTYPQGKLNIPNQMSWWVITQLSRYFRNVNPIVVLLKLSWSSGITSTEVTLPFLQPLELALALKPNRLNTGVEFNTVLTPWGQVLKTDKVEMELIFIIASTDNYQKMASSYEQLTVVAA